MNLSDFGRYHFEPPIELVPDKPAPQTLGQVVAHALVTGGDYHPLVVDKLFDRTVQAIDGEINKKPNMATVTVRAALKGKHTVTFRD